MKGNHRRPWRRAFLGAVAGLALAVVPACPRAETTLVVGATGNAAVEVNLGALDALGASGAARASGSVILMPIPSAVVVAGAPSNNLATAHAAVPSLPMAQAPLNLAPPPLPAAQPAIAAAVSEPAVVASPPEPAETEVAAAPPEPEPEPPPPPEPVAQPEPEPEPAQPIASVAEPEPLPAVEPEPLPEEEAQVASVEPSGAIDLTEEGQVLSLAFEAGESDLDGATVNALSALVTEMRRDEGARVQLIAYAGVNGGSASSARRLSLSRALAVRGYLIENGVRSTRIDVRALGDNVDDGSPERVDVFVLPR